MHPLLPYGAGALLAAAGWAVASGGVRERYERVAFAAGLVLALAGGGALFAAGWPPIPELGKRGFCTAAVGASASLLGAGGGVLAQCGSGGFSSERTKSMIVVAVAALLLAFGLPGARPA